MAIETSARVDEFFQQGVADACKKERVDASVEAQQYLAGLLCDFALPEKHQALNETLSRSITLMLDETLKSQAPDRFERLKSIGDGALYISGFFKEHFESRGIHDELIASLGGLAYKSAGQMLVRETLAPHQTDLFTELAEKFSRCVRVLAAFAAQTTFGRASNHGILRLYERWVRTRSDSAARELALAGLLPSTRTGRA